MMVPMSTPKTLSPNDLYRIVRGFVIALATVVVAFGVTIWVVWTEAGNRRTEVCDVVRGAFHEQAILFGEFTQSPEEDPRLAEYDERLQEALEAC